MPTKGPISMKKEKESQAFHPANMLLEEAIEQAE